MNTIRISVIVAGSDGLAIGSGRAGIRPARRLHALAIKYTDQPATADVTITCVHNGVTKTLLTRTDTATDFPLSTVHEAGKDSAGANVAAGKAGELVLPVITGELVVAVAQGNAGSVEVVAVTEAL